MNRTRALHVHYTSKSSILFFCWSVVCGLWSVVCGLWSVVCGLWSATWNGHIQSFFGDCEDIIIIVVY